jgi:hypothetical protein
VNVQIDSIVRRPTAGAKRVRMKTHIFGHRAFVVAVIAALIPACGSDGPPQGHRDPDSGAGASTGMDGSGAGAVATSDAGGAHAAGGSGGTAGGFAAAGSGGIAGGHGAGSGGHGGRDAGSGTTPDATADGSATGGRGDTGGHGGSGGATTMGDGGPDGRAPDPNLLGQRCVKSSDCGPGLQCVTAASNTFGGGIANGFCTLDCSADILSPISSESACASISSTAICFQHSATSAFCTQPCAGGPVAQPTGKCHGRQDVACSGTSAGLEGYCAPTCRGDFECAGRKCDLAEGLCVDSLGPGRSLPIGAKCDPNASSDPCEGVCVGIDDGQVPLTVGFCSGYCRLGDRLGCGVDPLSTGPVAAACLLGTTLDSDYGDLGFCSQLCDCNNDCTDPDFVCDPVVGLQALSGRVGACTSATAVNGDPTGIACN